MGRLFNISGRKAVKIFSKVGYYWSVKREVI